jgi:hypothetical protein
LEIDHAKDTGQTELQEQLTEAWFLLQRMHGDKLGNMIASYKPQMFGKNWSADPDYNKLAKELAQVAGTYKTNDIEGARK